MTLTTQLSFFNETKEPSLEVANKSDTNRSNFGTFRDSLRAPIHRWFTYPAGFSYKAVEEAFRLYKIKPGNRVFDPFAGTGTTNLVAKQHGIDSFGIEAHPFVHFVAETKLFWEFDIKELRKNIDTLINSISLYKEKYDVAEIELEKIFPELVLKCYTPAKLIQLYICRETIALITQDTYFQNFAKVGLTNLLRSVADVATGWPYIAPQKARKPSKRSNINVVEVFRNQLYQMAADLQQIREIENFGTAKILLGDSRFPHHDEISASSIDFAFTSPPYLNNYDYADRTRLEMYFWGSAKNWGDITEFVRKQLLTSATTQINRGNYNVSDLLSEELKNAAPSLVSQLEPKVNDLSKLRLTKGGKKSYDIMVAGYFNDMFKVLHQTYQLLKPGSSFLLILGDSAPYGVYIPTDVYLGDIGLSVGFSNYKIEDLRERGGKWKDNPQRHSVNLKESILTLHKK